MVAHNVTKICVKIIAKISIVNLLIVTCSYEHNQRFRTFAQVL